jgi:hypothetical protein
MRTEKQRDDSAKLTNLFESVGLGDKVDYTILHGGGDLPAIEIPPITKTLFEIDESIGELLDCIICLYRERVLQRPT